MILKKSDSAIPQIGMFRMFGDNEVVLTSVFSYLLTIDSIFCRQICKPYIGKIKFNFKKIEIGKEIVRKENRKRDRTDIEIRQDGEFAIIFEAKIGDYLPSKIQIDTYLDRLKDYSVKNKKLVLLVGSAELMRKTVLDYYAGNPEIQEKIEILDWGQINVIVLSHLKKFKLKNRTYFTDFLNFINQDYKMKSYQKEVMIIGINHKFHYNEDSYEPIRGMSSADSVFKKRLYQASEKKLKYVLYLAFRYQGKLSHFAKVERQEYLSAQNLMIFHLEKILEIPEQFIKKVRFGYHQGIQHTTLQKIFDPEIINFKELVN